MSVASRLVLGLALILVPVARAQDADVEQIRKEAEKIQGVVEKIRGLEFKSDVKKGVQNKDELRKFVLEEMEKELPDEKIRALEKSYAKIGFIKHGLDLKRTLVDLYTEQVAGFYNPERKELFLIHHGGPEQSMLMAHELTHALQDQHFDLFKMQKSIVDDDDRSLALTSLVEGEATVVMVAYMLKGEAGVDIPVASLPDIGMILSMSNKMGDMLGSGEGQEKLKNAPKVLSENLLFGYVQGASFCQKLIKRGGGFDAVTRAFRDPPTSSEQILHPEKYTDERRDAPVAVALPDVAAKLGNGWKQLTKNVMGEFNTALLFKEKLRGGDSDRAAEGWGGDAWQCLEGPAGEVVFVWYSSWDRGEDASEFARTFERFHQARADGSELTIEKAGDADVIVVDGGGETVRRKVVEMLRAGTKVGGDSVAAGGGNPVIEAPVEAPPGTKSANPFADVRAPEGWKETRGEGGKVVFEGPNGARLQVSSTPTAAKTVKALAERHMVAAGFAETQGGYDILDDRTARIRIEPGGDAVRRVRALAVLDGKTSHQARLTARPEGFEAALRAVIEANPSLARLSTEDAPAAAPKPRKREPSLY